MRLTDLTIQKLPIPEKGQKTYWEGGFGVRVSQGGSKTFVVMYGKDRSLKSIGRYPAVSLKTARSQSNHFLAMKVPSRSQKTLSEARDAFIDECEGRCRPATVSNYRLFLNRLTKEKLDQVTRTDVPQSPHAIMAAKVFFNWCIKNDLIDRNPFAKERVSYNKRSRVLSQDEIREIWAYEAAPMTNYLKLCLLTGQRRGQFNAFEIRDDMLYFPATSMKGAEEHTIPLLPLARTYAERIQPFNGWSKGKARMDRIVTIPHWTPHDLRRTFSTTMASLKVPLHITEAILAHKTGSVSGVAAVYNRYSYLEESREALAMYEAHMLKLVGRGE